MEILLLVILLFALASVFTKVSDWFQKTKNINILPATLVELIAVLLLAFNYGKDNDSSTVWVSVAVGIILVVTIFNLFTYGFKNGALASCVELLFSVSVVFMLVLTVSSLGNRKKKHRKHGRK